MAILCISTDESETHDLKVRFYAYLKHKDIISLTMYRKDNVFMESPFYVSKLLFYLIGLIEKVIFSSDKNPSKKRRI